MKRYPLQTLIQVRAHRAEKARRHVLECLRRAETCRDACVRIEGEIIALQFQRNEQRARLLDPPPPGAGWSTTLAQREAHIDLLETQAEAARQRLFKAQAVLREAEEALAAARAAFFRAKAKLDALEQRKQHWRREETMRELRVEELAAADIVAGPPASVGMEAIAR